MDDRTPGYDDPDWNRDELLRPITEDEFSYIVAAQSSRTELALFDPRPEDGKRWV